MSDKGVFLMEKYDFLEVRRKGFLQRQELKRLRKLIGCGACSFLKDDKYCTKLNENILGPLNLRSCPEWKRNEES